MAKKSVEKVSTDRSKDSSDKKRINSDVSVGDETVVTGKAVSKYKAIDIEDDPMQYHAKPRDLSKNALKRPIAQMSHSSHIFTRVPFSKFKLDKQLSEHLEKSQDDGGMALMSCTRVQSVVITALETKQNILMKSETGSGKTMAYCVPIIDDLLKLSTPVSRSQGTYAIILAPTRELCSQIGDVIENITKCCVSIVGGCISGGEKRKSEKARLRKGVSILVGTPGRLLDHLRATESFTLNKLRWVVLDEADRLLDMGFEQTILEICSIVGGVVLPGLKQKNDTGGKSGEARTNLVNKWQQNSLHQSKICNETDSLSFIMASATLTKAVKHLAMPLMGGQGFLVVDAERNAVQKVTDINDLLSLGKDTGRLDGGVGKDGDIIDMDDGEDEGEGEGGDAHVAKKARAGDLARNEMVEVPEQLSQYFMMVTCKWRLAALVSFLRVHKDEKVMVFFATCDSVDYHALLFRNTQWPLELDAPLPVHSSDGSGDKSKTPQGPKPGADQYLDPLEYTFSGLFGEDCNMFRLHGNVPQNSRKLVYKQYCKASKGILLCTDVAARGLDLPKVDWIVQYDPPCETTDYVHRIGRTARKGEGGSAVIFLLPTEAPYIQLLQSHGMVPRPLSLQSLFIESSSYIPGVGKFNNIDEMTAVIIQRRVEGVVYRNRYLLDAGRQAFRSFVRAYATHSSDAKGIFKVQSLHLGHVAKCFALRESPHALRNHDDVMGKIFNGMFTQAVLGDDKLKKKNRDEKYALSKKGKSGGAGAGGRSSSSSDSGSSKPPPALAKNEKQKMRKMGGGAGGLAPSGSFRKTSGYFRKKLRANATAEFQS
jgi:ATP-dependent RNA helicase DDX31/DBP7